MSLPTIDDLGDLRGKRVLVRVDFNVPTRMDGGRVVVSDDRRIRASLPLFEQLRSRGATVAACTHFGRPNGAYDAKFSVEPIREVLHRYAPEVELLENLRFNAGEEGNSKEFARELATGFDAYVNEAFGASHRDHASIVLIPRLLPSAAGPNLLREVETIVGLLSDPKRPFVAIVGGAKVADKLGVTTVLSAVADRVIVGGGMAFTFWRALGYSIGDSLVDDSRLDDVREVLSSGKIALPLDIWSLPTGAAFGAGGTDEPELSQGFVADGRIGLDIGPASIESFRELIADAQTILWNGPMGVFEDPRLEQGTRAIAEALASSSGTTVVGGGDSAAAAEQFGVSGAMTFVSTGGGASLELVEFGDLPGLAALREGRSDE